MNSQISVVSHSKQSLSQKDKLNVVLENTRDLALKRRARWLIDKLDIQKGDTILDAGCGDGFYLFLVSQVNSKTQLIGADFEILSLESAKLKLRSKKIKLLKVDLTKKIPFPANKFDKVVLSEVIEHLPDDVWSLKEINRVIRPGGVLVLSVPHANYSILWDPLNWILERLFKKHIHSGFFAGIWNQHQRLYTDKLLRRSLEKAGFEAIEIDSLTFWSFPFSHYLINFGARILASNKKASLLVSADKFNLSKQKSFSVFNVLFLLMKMIDSLNDLWYPRSQGVSLVAAAKKKV